MRKPFLWMLACGLLLIGPLNGQDDYLKITTSIKPEIIGQGMEGVLKVKIQPRDGIRISAAPEFVIKLEENSNLTFSKYFFTASELDFETEQENENVYLDLEKEISIPFKVNDNSLIGKQQISGEIQFTGVFKDHWSLKTFQKFSTSFRSRRNRTTAARR